MGAELRRGPIRSDSSPTGAIAGVFEVAVDLLPFGYEPVRLLGEGGFGRVYLTRRNPGKTSVALKLASPKVPGALASLDREREALAAIRSRAVPEFLDAGELQDGSRWLAMQAIAGLGWPGRSMADPPIPLELGLTRFDGLLRALGEIHAAGYLHSDLKPGNILVRSDGSVCFIDFGLARRPSNVSLPEDDRVVGTPHYMSPEGCTPGSIVGFSSDVYAAAILLYALLSGRPPFEGSAEEIREGHRSKRPASLASLGVPTAIDEVLLAALAKDPRDRPASANEFADRLIRAREHAGSFTIADREPEPVVDRSASPEQNVVILRFHADAPVVALRSAVHGSGGQLVQAKGRDYVAAFTRTRNDSPMQAALAAGHVLLRRGLVDRTLADVVAATVRRKPDGSERISSKALQSGHEPLDETIPLGVLVTVRAARSLPDLAHREVPGHDDLRLVTAGDDPKLVSTVGEAVLPIFGREMELRCLADDAALSLGHVPGLATIVGERGHGKTRLAQAIVEVLCERMPDSVVVPFRVPDPAMGRPESVIGRLLTAVLPLPTKAPADPVSTLRERLGDEPAEDLVLGISVAMGWTSASDPVLSRLRAAPLAVRSLLARALGEVLLRRARARPLCVVIDDAQFLDDAVLDALEYATRSEVRAPLWIAVFGRVGFGGSRPAWGAQATIHRVVRLAALTADDAGTLVRHLLRPATNVSDSIVAHLVERTRGIPLVIVELLRGLRRDGLVRQSDSGRGCYVDTDAVRAASYVPTVEWLVERELDALAPSLRAHAGLASVMGPWFRIEHMAKVVRELERTGGRPPSDLDPAVGVRRLLRAGVLVEDAGRIAFRHDLLRERAYASVPVDERKDCHRAAYRVVASQSLAEEERLLQWAFHADGAGLLEAAVEHRLALARRAVDRHDYVLAGASFQRALERLQPEDPRRLVALQGLGLMRFRTGRHEDALRDLMLALELARERGDRSTEFEVLLDTATVLDWSEDYPTSAAYVEVADALGVAATSEHARARILKGRGRAHCRRGELVEAATLLREAARVAAGIGDAGYETHVIALLMAGPIAALTGDEAGARSMFDELLALCHEHRDELHLATTYLNRSTLWVARGGSDELIADLTRAIEVARRGGLRLVETRALISLAGVYYWQRRYDEAIQQAQACIELALAVAGDAQKVAMTRLLLARCHLLCGDDVSARHELDKIAALQDARRAVGAVDADFMPGEQVLHRMIELALDRADDAQWDQLIELAESSALQEELMEIVEVSGVRAAEAGRWDRAHTLLGRARALVNTLGLDFYRTRILAHCAQFGVPEST